MIEQDKYQQLIFRILQIAVIGVFVGRAWQHLLWDAPFRAVLWDEKLMSNFVTNWLSMSWEDYVRSESIDNSIQNIIKGFGWFYLFLAVLTVFIKKIPNYLRSFLWLGSLSLMLLAFIYMKSKFNVIGQFFEYSLQFSAPIFLLLFLTKNYAPEKLLPFLKAAISLTFLCHGLYAVGYYPRPMNFVQMTISTFGCSEEFAHTYLTVAAWFDFIVAILIWFKPKIALPALYYCVFWGFVTSAARIVGNFYPEFWMEILSKWTPEVLYRIPHFLVPLAVIFMIKKNETS